MRQIKFRGKLANGKFVYGDVVQWGGHEIPRICSWKNGCIYDIEPESVAQLIAVDKNGCEVYEGDKVIRIAPAPDWDDFDAEKAFPMAATFEDYGAIIGEQIILAEAQS